MSVWTNTAHPHLRLVEQHQTSDPGDENDHVIARAERLLSLVIPFPSRPDPDDTPEAA